MEIFDAVPRFMMYKILINVIIPRALYAPFLD